MEIPEEIEQYVLLRTSDRAGPLSTYVARQILEQLDGQAEEMYFVIDLTRRYKLHLGRPAGELLTRSSNMKGKRQSR